MSLALDDLPRDPEWLLLQLQHMTEAVAAERSRSTALEIERDTVLAERDAAQAEIEKLRLLIRQLQRGQFGRRSEKLDPDQLLLAIEDTEQAIAANEATADKAMRQPQRRGRKSGVAIAARFPPICRGAM
jgi:transposase